MNRTQTTRWLSNLAAIALVASMAAVGCSDDADDKDGNPADSTGALSLDDPANLTALCADPQAYDGRAITFSGDLIEEVATQTAQGCEANTCCGNAVWMSFTVPCGEDTLVLVAAPEAGFPVAQGRVDYPAGSQLEDLITQASTSFGCVGQECALECTPAPAADIATVSATFRFESSRDKFSGPQEAAGDGDYRMELEVDSVTLRD